MLGLFGFLKKNLELQGKLPDKWKDEPSDNYVDLSTITISDLQSGQLPVGLYKASEGVDIELGEDDFVVPAMSVGNSEISTPSKNTIFSSITGTVGFADLIKEKLESGEVTSSWFKNMPMTATGSRTIEYDIDSTSITGKNVPSRRLAPSVMFKNVGSSGTCNIMVTFIDNSTETKSLPMTYNSSTGLQVTSTLASFINTTKGLKHVKLEFSGLNGTGTLDTLSYRDMYLENEYLETPIYLTSMDFGDFSQKQLETVLMPEMEYTGVCELGTAKWQANSESNSYVLVEFTAATV